ncbi:hypothetical protein BG015_010433 [Linnemannia schmuckeri]|uniref:Uncharacterized protein n=1 Tax=Linnemannia schmuckeri TaxID=64567 RepID=A0A9P5V8V7_9FUNG|nr:hypothetical protein BG015_010433 [Linnemannia schmuckeri]
MGAEAIEREEKGTVVAKEVKRSGLAGEEKNAAAVNKRGGEEEAEPGWWVWNDKRETDNARGFEVRELAKTHNKGKGNGTSKREGSEGDEDSRWEFKREIHQGGVGEHSGRVDSVVMRSGIPERPLKPEQKKREREVEDPRGLEKGGWHFKA